MTQCNISCVDVHQRLYLPSSKTSWGPDDFKTAWGPQLHMCTWQNARKQTYGVTATMYIKCYICLNYSHPLFTPSYKLKAITSKNAPCKNVFHLSDCHPHPTGDTLYLPLGLTVVPQPKAGSPENKQIFVLWSKTAELLQGYNNDSRM